MQRITNSYHSKISSYRHYKNSYQQIGGADPRLGSPTILTNFF